MNIKKIHSLFWLVGICGSLMASVYAATSPQTFETPEQAVAALFDLIGKHDAPGIEAMFGPGSVDMFDSGDAADDEEDFQRVRQMILEKVAFEDYDEHTKIALLGKDEWPWPIPLDVVDGRWHFDTAKGREELLNRRIGRNELMTITTLHEIVDAQREYYATPYVAQTHGYAQKFLSSNGQHDGLYWPVATGEPPSPLGDLLAESEVNRDSPQPFHGYFYRMLTAQGANAPGGKKSYINAGGVMDGGFAVIAWPAKHGNSGVMSFLISQRGIAFQKDLGTDTATAAAALRSYDPDVSWAPIDESVEADDNAPPAEY